MAELGTGTALSIPDEGDWYYLDETVRIDRSARKTRLVKDPQGTYVVASCERATTTGGHPVLKVTVRLGGA
jgi:hypothetical protein